MTLAADLLALLIVALISTAMVYWFLVHGLLPLWRRLGILPAWSLMLILTLAVPIAVVVFRRQLLVGGPFFHPLTFAGGVVTYGLNTWLWLQGRQVLDTRTMVGMPELAPETCARPLLQEGIYARVRHPRYVSAWLFLLSMALFLGYPVLWWLLGVSVVGFLLISRLEERELAQRYGEEFELYRQRVPACVPDIRSLPGPEGSGEATSNPRDRISGDGG
ncbi:MAG: isoprenylcysteine carboxylmethyltransferase family protein [Holophagales bacterium]|nr:isoprenylcysteine carboxylmethyltransferase family protein [Holophagales bacterium]